MTADVAAHSAERAVTALLDALKAKEGVELPDAILELSSKADDDPVVVRQMGRLLHHGWKSLSRRRFFGRESGALIDLARRGAALEGASRHMRTALDHLALWSTVDEYLAESGLGLLRFHEIFSRGDHVVALRERVAGQSAELGTGYGPRMHEAMLASIDSREHAAELFRAAAAENPEFADVSSLDEYLWTYFDRGTIESEAALIARRRADLMEEFELLSAPGWRDGAGTLILFSCDPAYFVVHFPYWVAAIRYLRERNIRLHFLLAGDREEVAEIVDRSAAVIESISRLRGRDAASAFERISFSRVAVPDYVADPKTFHACARFLLAEELRRGFRGNVLILDVDMMVRTDPTSFLRQLADLPDTRLALAIDNGLASLMPARRYIAHTFPVPGGELGRQVMRDLEDYIYVGLSSSVSWTLDQNALTYAVEPVVARGGPEALLGLNEIGRPFAQFAGAKSLFVSMQRELHRRSGD